MWRASFGRPRRRGAACTRNLALGDRRSGPTVACGRTCRCPGGIRHGTPPPRLAAGGDGRRLAGSFAPGPSENPAGAGAARTIVCGAAVRWRAGARRSVQGRADAANASRKLSNTTWSW